jgi:hypothetical protein
MGIPYVGVSGSQSRVAVTFVSHPGECDTGFGAEVGCPIPEESRAQPNDIEGGVAGGGSSGDRHLVFTTRRTLPASCR